MLRVPAQDRLQPEQVLPHQGAHFSGSPRLASRGVRFVLAGIEVLGRVAEPDHNGLIWSDAGSLCPATHRCSFSLVACVPYAKSASYLSGGHGRAGTAPQRHGGVDCSPNLYPHPVELGHRVYSHRASHLDTARAARELTSLFEHQWRNGKVPHIVLPRHPT